MRDSEGVADGPAASSETVVSTSTATQVGATHVIGDGTLEGSPLLSSDGIHTLTTVSNTSSTNPTTTITDIDI